MILFFILRNLLQILTGTILFAWLVVSGYTSGQTAYYFWAFLVLFLVIWMLRGKIAEMRGR